jgi:hypothetical protein
MPVLAALVPCLLVDLPAQFTATSWTENKAHPYEILEMNLG